MTSTAKAPAGLNLAAYARDGFAIARGLFSRTEMDVLREHFRELHARAPIQGLYEPLAEAEAEGDVLKRFPRVMHPHRFDERSRRYLLDPRVFAILRLLLHGEPLAAQSMYYFKPPGARGQGFHQDNFYLQARPATCLAAWTAVDDTDEENGALYVYPGTHGWKLLCPAEDERQGLWRGLPKADPVPVRMASGDVLFFNGALVHGSRRNASATRWRRSFICHYISREHCDALSDFYHPVLDAAGNAVSKEKLPHEGVPCGGEDGNGAR